MPIPEQRDLDKARGVIRDWLASKLPDTRDLTISPLIGPAFTGFSNETLLFDADHETKWRRALAKLHVDPLLLSDVAGHA